MCGRGEILLYLAGVAGYEGGIGAGTGERGSGQAVQEVAAFCRRLRTLADTLVDTLVDTLGAGHREDGEEEFIVTAGGSAFFDVVARELTAGGTNPVTAVLRSGAYLTWSIPGCCRYCPFGMKELSGTGGGSSF